MWVPLHSAAWDWSRFGEKFEILSHHPRNQSWREGRFFSINILSFCHHHNTRVQRPDKLQERINFHFYQVEHFPTTISQWWDDTLLFLSLRTRKIMKLLGNDFTRIAKTSGWGSEGNWNTFTRDFLCKKISNSCKYKIFSF